MAETAGTESTADSAPRLLCRQAAELLNLTEVQPEDRFLDLGGTSLQAVRFSLRVEQTLGLRLPLRAILENESFEALAQHLEEIPETTKTSVDGEFSGLSKGQQSLWLMQSMHPDSGFYNVFDLKIIHGTLDVTLLTEAINQVARRHTQLQAIFPQRNGVPVHERGAPRHLEVVDVEDNLRTLRVLATEHIQQPFDLTNGPLFRPVLFCLSSSRHALLLCLHHMISDAWTLGVLHREISEAYNRQSSATEPLDFEHFALAEQNWINSADGDATRNYWQAQLSGAPAYTELPLDHPRPARLTVSGAHTRRPLPPRLIQSLQKLAREQNTSLYAVFLAAFSALLYRLARTQDVVFGSPFAGRTQPHSESAVGYFANVLPLRIACEGNPSVVELLKVAKQTMLDGFEHQQMPFPSIVEATNPPRSAAHHPIYQVVFAYQNAQRQAGELSLTECRTEHLDIDCPTAKYDWSLFVEERSEGLTLHAEYNTDLFERATITRWLEHYQTLLKQFAADPQQPALEISLSSERKPVSAKVSNTGCVQTHFERQVDRTPNATAITGETGSMTYAVLNKRANAVANALLALGLQPGAPVSIAVPRSLEAIVAILGTLKAGGAYLPLDAAYPEERLQFMVQQASCDHIISTSQLGEQLSALCTHSLFIDQIAPSAETAENPGIETNKTALANIIYTSGSTGQPKGVAVPHQAIVRLVRDTAYANFGPDQVFLHAAPLSFDAATFEIWGALLNGGTCAVLPAGTPDPQSLQRTIEEHGATTAWLTSSLFNLIIDEAPYALKGLQNILAGGEALSPRHIREAQRALPGVQLINGYGPTENTTFTCCYRIPEEFPVDARHVPIGTAINGTYVRVLDERQQPVPHGVPGELYIGGIGLALGYVNQPELTAERFVADPIDPEGRLYRSGDLVRQLSDGNLEFIGRIDRQVKVRGHRIELEEIEAVIDTHPQVNECIVDTLTHNDGDTTLAAFVVPSHNNTDPAQMTEYLKSKLPSYMVPSRLLLIDALPITANGKADRAKLHQMLAESSTSQHEPAIVDEMDEVESWLAETWRELLEAETPSIHDSFFDLGGTSINAVRLMSRIQKQYGCELPLSELFETPTIASLATRIRSESSPNEWSPIVPIQPNGTKPPLFMVHALGGNVVGFAEFASHLDGTRPLYGIQAHGLISGQKLLTTLEDMAASYIQHIRRVQPHGPYHLGGISMGGAIAFEMALQLREAGEEVDYLIVGDTWFTHGPHVTPIRWKLSRLTALLFDAPRKYFQLRRDRAERMAIEETAVEEARQAYGPELEKIHTNAFHNYTPRSYDGPVTLVRTENLSTHHLHLERCFGKNMGWDQLTSGGVRRYMVPGPHHYLCYFENAARFAEIIDASTAKSIEKM